MVPNCSKLFIVCVPNCSKFVQFCVELTVFGRFLVFHISKPLGHQSKYSRQFPVIINPKINSIKCGVVFIVNQPDSTISMATISDYAIKHSFYT